MTGTDASRLGAGDQANVSVVIPTYRRPEYLRDAVASAIDQSPAPAEVIVSDNDPNESGREAVVKLGSGITYVTANSLKGASHTRNTGGHAARGEWLAFLDDDDLWLPGYLEQAISRATESGADMVLTPTLRQFEAETHPGKTPYEGIELDTLLGEGNTGVVGSNIFIKRQVFLSLGGFDESMPTSEDVDLLARVLESGRPYAVASEALVVQRQHPGSRLTDVHSRAIATGAARLLEKYGRQSSREARRRLRGRFHAAAYVAERNPVLKIWHLAAAIGNGHRGSLAWIRRKRRSN